MTQRIMCYMCDFFYGDNIILTSIFLIFLLKLNSTSVENGLTKNRLSLQWESLTATMTAPDILDIPEVVSQRKLTSIPESYSCQQLLS